MNLLQLPRAQLVVLLLALLLPIFSTCGTANPTTSAPDATGASTESSGAETDDSATTTAESNSDSILHIHQSTYPDVFDPQKSSFSNEIGILAMAYEGLTKLNENLDAVPAATES
ncbi:MAG: peptide ABC transporter substrate-binding protein [Chloroflexi bacterium AL-W]|nr:peptide ABC transporter substrate-binding protein [Chloroflexi bacterium AL-N1]NOK70859.1 peptide ABC transporter substrate-binding protein [Chloroflexi bacterium AL-N10]NOK78419.1 peptide ABC transporter substrate-binding protein [Chloroflexi bacterium AL-N5]NOK85400.1 peptide ABC transporter substrate-binding protein [Chloroflexi bacterium AL-W]NOK92676.1 peptide ABC transporter substrate-binding protein [Chloroflexi bacterium AL-N15]